MSEPSRWARTLVDTEPNPALDLDDSVGQRSATFTFTMTNVITGYQEEVHPVKGLTPILTHDVGRTIKRQINGLYLDRYDTSRFNTISSRISIAMVIGGRSYPLGTYMPSNQMRFVWTSGTESAPSFYDEGFIVDQETTTSFGTSQNAGITGAPVQDTLEKFLSNYPVNYLIEPSTYITYASWSMGTHGGYIVEQLALDGDWFSPWLDHHNVMRFIRSFDPATKIPTLDFDKGNRVFREKITESDDLILAPNRIVVVSNGISAVGENSAPAVGIYDIPSSAPHSIANRGFVIQKTETRQLTSSTQAAAVARNLGQRYTVFETAEIDTAPDPRHDGYDVIRWRGENWLEISWSLPLLEGSAMSHVLRKAYRD